MVYSGALYPSDPSICADICLCQCFSISHQCVHLHNSLIQHTEASHMHWAWTKMLIITCRSPSMGMKAAIPQSDRWGMVSSSNKIFADLKFRCTIAGRHTSCKYLAHWHTGISFHKPQKAQILLINLICNAHATQSLPEQTTKFAQLLSFSSHWTWKV